MQVMKSHCVDDSLAGTCSHTIVVVVCENDCGA